MSTNNNNDGGPAFPFGTKETTYDSYGGHRQDVSESHAPGMTLRDWFAGQAMAAATNHRAVNPFNEGAPEEIAALSYRIADAMLAARSTQP